MTEYVKFTEENEQKAETWHFYIPVTGNEAALAELEEVLDSAERNETYTLDMAPIPGSVVDVLVKYANDDTNCLNARNKLDGVLALTPTVDDYFTNGDGGDPFYKGGIRDFMKVQ